MGRPGFGGVSGVGHWVGVGSAAFIGDALECVD